MNDIISLTWTDFGVNLFTALSLHRNESEFYDVTLVSDDMHRLSAHKLILSACSEYFKTILSSIKEYSHPVICLDGVSYNDLSSALDYMYNGEVQIEQDNLDNFLTTARKLKLNGLLPKEEKIEHQDDILDAYNLTFNSSNARKISKSLKICKEKKSCLTKSEGDELLNQTYTDHIQKIQRYYHCKMCRKRFNTRKLVQEHIETHLDFSALDLQCDPCDKSYRSIISFQKHMIGFHKTI